MSLATSTSAKALQRSSADKCVYLYDGSLLIGYWNGSAGQVAQVTSPLTSPSVTNLFTTAEDAISLWADNSTGTSSYIWVASSDDDASGAGPAIHLRSGTYTSGGGFSWNTATSIPGTTQADTISCAVTWNGTYLIVFMWDGVSGTDRLSYAYTTDKTGQSGWTNEKTLNGGTWSTIVQVAARHSVNLGATVIAYGGNSRMFYGALADGVLGQTTGATASETGTWSSGTTAVGARAVLAVSQSGSAPVLSCGDPKQVRATSGSVTGTWGNGQSRTAGNLLVAVVSATGTTSAAAVSPPSGWTRQVSAGAATLATCAILTATAAGADAAPAFTSTISGTATMTCTLFELANANTTTPVDTSGAASTASSTITTQTVTTSGNISSAGDYLITGFVRERTASTATWTAGTGWWNVANDGSTSSTGHCAVDVKGAGPELNNWAGGGATGFYSFADNYTNFGGPQLVVDEATGDIHCVRAMTTGGGPTNSGICYWHGTYSSGTVSWSSVLVLDADGGAATPADIGAAVDGSSRLYVTYTDAATSGNLKYATLVSPFTSVSTGPTVIVAGSGSANQRWPHSPPVSASMGGLGTALPVLYTNTFSSPYPVNLDTSVTLPASVTLANSFDGGSNGTTITTANSGGTSGDAFDLVNTGTSATVAFDNAHAHSGSLSNKMATTTADNWAVEWTTSAGTRSQIWFRLYLYFTANPGAIIRVWGCNMASAVCANLVIGTTGKVAFNDNTGSPIITTTNSIALNQWVRVEGYVTGAVSTGQMEMKLFNSPDSTTPTETQTSTAAQATSGPPVAYIYGDIGAAVASVTYWQDDIGLSSTGYLGPAVVSVPGAAALSGSGALTVAAQAGFASGAALSGTGALTAARLVTQPAAASLSGAGTLTTAGLVTFTSAASLSGTGALGATGQKTVPAAAALSGTGALAATAAVTFAPAAALTGSGSLAAQAAVTFASAVALSGSGTVTAPRSVQFPGALALSGTGSLGATETGTFASAAALSGAGALTAQGIVTQPAAAALSGSGALGAVRAVTWQQAAALSGTGTVTAQGAVTQPAASALSGSGALTVAPAVQFTSACALSGSGGMTAAGLVKFAGTAALSGAGALTAAALVTQPASAALSGTGSVSAAATLHLTASASLAGSGTLAAAALVTQPASASLAGSGSVTAAAAVQFSSAAALSGGGSLTAAAAVSGLATGSASLSGSGALAAASAVRFASAAVLSGTGTLTATALVTQPAAASLSGSGTLSAAVAVRLAVSAALSGLGALAASALVTQPASASLSGSGTLTAAGSVSGFTAASAALSGSGAIAAGASPVLFQAAALSGTGTLAAGGLVTALPAAALSGTGLLAAAVAVTIPASATLSGQGAIAAAVLVTAPSGALLSGTGAMTAGPSLVIAASVSLAGFGTITALVRVITPVTEPTVTWRVQPAAGRWHAEPQAPRWLARPASPRWHAAVTPPRWTLTAAPRRWRIIMTSFSPIAAVSLEEVNVTWTSGLAGTSVDPTGATTGEPELPVQMAFPVSSGNPAEPSQPVTWFTASWLLATTSIGYVAQALVGPGAGVVTLTAGLSYDVWSKVTGSPEVPAKFAGTLPVY